MKNGILILLCSSLGVVLMAIVLTIGNHMNRSVEFQENMSGAVERTMEEMVNREQSVRADEMVEECIQQMAISMDSDTDIEFRVYQADAEKGILSVRAVGNYQHLNESQGDVVWERTVIYDQNIKDETETMYRVQFYDTKEELLKDGRCYKTLVVLNGTSISEPYAPTKEGRIFAGWRDINDYVADFSQPVTQDISYYAAWE